MKKGSKKRLITDKEKDLNRFSGRLIEQIKKKGYDIENDCHVINDMIQDMEKIIDMPSNSYKTIKSHVFGGNCDVNWLKRYCEYFDCPADYLLGFIEKDFADIHTKTGLSNKAIRKLVTNKDYRFVTNAMLEKNGIDYIVQALQADSFYSTQTNYIASLLYKTDKAGKVIEKDKKLHGVTLEDLGFFKSNLDSGYKEQQENFAIVCFDNLRTDKSLSDYFFKQTTKRFEDQLEKDIQKYQNPPAAK